ncbi:MAG: DNRLRE domain-containing protein [Actinomycetota bacterium]|nr:DNRLRE domain-containing protein [Actinomycetota bacterium]
MLPPFVQQLTRALVPVALLASAAGGAVAASAGPGDGRPHPEVRALKPVADTYVTVAAPHSNFGRARVLRADGMPVTQTFLRFKLRNLRDAPERVTLLLYSNDGSRTTYEVRRVRGDDEWSERRLTYANAPRLSLQYAPSTRVLRGRWSAVDVTTFVGDGDEISLAITTRSARSVSFGSRESRYGPRLAVQFGGDREDPDDDEEPEDGDDAKGGATSGGSRPR